MANEREFVGPRSYAMVARTKTRVHPEFSGFHQSFNSGYGTRIQSAGPRSYGKRFIIGQLKDNGLYEAASICPLLTTKKTT